MVSINLLVFIVGITGICPIPEIDVLLFRGHKGPSQLEKKPLCIIDYAIHRPLLFCHLMVITKLFEKG